MTPSPFGNRSDRLAIVSLALGRQRPRSRQAANFARCSHRNCRSRNSASPRPPTPSPSRSDKASRSRPFNPTSSSPAAAAKSP